ncbi:hypothetical protein Rhopal_005188-T1 [Rhodotorula paludigena]|uniref:F-box domain-containing protein n=1 Tax=Rhodotorula paludigena TaxID=86838 RepID=A0AAV5GPR9_9BASI|nr:hypothetical protein Rhopal_005188-T1 [Rhodotorula paludigena]
MAKRYSTTTVAGEASGGAVVPPGGSGSPAPDEGAHGGSPASDEQPKPKKARSAMSKVKGRRGAMSAFNSLPIDLLFDICTYLDPQDLFVLSNTNKVFRSIVTGPHAPPLWVAARERVGLPELELPMPDLQYAQLLFGRGCSFCVRKNAGKADVFYRARICTACLKEHFANGGTGPGSQAIQKAVNHRLHPLTMSIVNHTNPVVRNGASVRIAEVVKTSDELWENYPEAAESYAEQTFIAMYRLELSTGSSQGERWKPETDFQQWYCKDIEPARTARRKDGEALRRWVQHQEQAKAMDKDDIRRIRHDDIVSRFRAQGFGDRDFSYKFDTHTLVRKPDLLTERMWLKIEPPLREFLLTTRRDLRRNTILQRIGDLRWLSPTARDEVSLLADFYPAQTVVSVTPTFAALLADVSEYVDPVQLWADNKAAIVSELDSLVRSRIEEMLRTLAKVYGELKRARSDDKEDDAIEGLKPSTINLPRLPSFIPRTVDKPLVATDEQLVTFLKDATLSIFRCPGCKLVETGYTALKHAVMGHCGVHNMTMVSEAQWARCGQATDNSIETTPELLLRILYLRQLHADTKLEAPSHTESLEDDAKQYKVEMDDGKKFDVTFTCCDKYYNAIYQRMDPVPRVFRHIETFHSAPSESKASLSTSAEHSQAFRSAIHTARIIAGDAPAPAPFYPMGDGFPYDMYDSDPYGYDSDPDGYDSDDGVMSGYRDDCTIM